MTATLRSCVRGVGAALPSRIVTNEELARSVDTSDAWIQQRTGIKQRYVAGEGETTATLATQAAEAALRHAGLAAADIDLVIVATATPDYTFPAVATQVQASLGIVEGAAFDLQAVCTGFVYAVATADKFLLSGSHKRALVIGAETSPASSTGATAPLACCSATGRERSCWKRVRSTAPPPSPASSPRG